MGIRGNTPCYLTVFSQLSFCSRRDKPFTVEPVKDLLKGMVKEFIIIFFKDLFFVVAALIPIINPMGQMPVFLSLTEDIRKDDRKILAQKIATYGFIILLVSMLIGTYLLKFFGISLSAVQIGGGLLVCATGWGLLQTKETQTATTADQQHIAENPEVLYAAYSKRAFYPLTFPLSVGPGSISVAITLGANLKTNASNEVITLVASFGGLIIVAMVTYVCYRFADRLVAKLGEIGTIIILRMSAFILLCLGIQIIWNGLSELIPHLINKS